MIFEVIKILSQQVEDFIGSSITMANVAMLESEPGNSNDLNDEILLTLLNINEESTLKNFPNNSTSGDRVQFKNPIINLNLFILFCANRNSYEQSLRDISNIIEFFQGKKVFTQSNTTYNRSSVELENINNFKFTVELYTPTFEELNYIWGSLGGKQFPSVLYKLSLVQIERNAVTGQAGVLTETDHNSKLN